MSEGAVVAAVLIFAATYLVLAIGRVPPFRIDRTGAAVIGASLMVAFDVVSLDEAYAAVNHDTILLLFGMMIVVANLRLSGVFAAVSEWVVEHTRSPLALLVSVTVISGLFSAFFVNDTMCLVLTPLVLDIALQQKRNPVPYLLAVAMASNAGSVATVTGNPQNMMIGSFSRISYRDFAAALTPTALVGLALTVAIIALVYRREMRTGRKIDIDRRPVRVNRVLMWKSVAVSIGMVVFFFLGWPVAKVAIVAGGILLITRRVKPQKVYRDIDWSLLVLFVGLFIVVAGIEKAALSEDIGEMVTHLGLRSDLVMTVVAALLSNVVSNVPAVLLFKPFMPHLADPQHGWLVLAMSSTLAGNLTILGSVANLIVVQRARRGGVTISFWEYVKTGSIVTVLSLTCGVLILSL